MDDLRDTLRIFRRFYLLVAKGLEEPPTCDICDSLLLYRVDLATERVYFMCTGCATKTYPGTVKLREMQRSIERFTDG